MELPGLYGPLASWWPLLTAPADYAEEAAIYARTLHASCAWSPRTVLDLGSGGGNCASHLKAQFELTLVDLSPGMIEVSRALNPECEHSIGDMRNVRLDREFDAVFVHDAISYMTSEADLRKAIDTAYAHCRDGGVALFVPDQIRETYCSSTHHGGGDAGGRSLRCVEWVHDPDPAGTTYVVDFAFLLKEDDLPVRVVHDHHVFGLFPRSTWLRLIGEAGFQASVVDVERSEDGFGGRELFIGVR